VSELCQGSTIDKPEWIMPVVLSAFAIASMLIVDDSFDRELLVEQCENVEIRHDGIVDLHSRNQVRFAIRKAKLIV